jgi:hypothetical protein
MMLWAEWRLDPSLETDFDRLSEALGSPHQESDSEVQWRKIGLTENYKVRLKDSGEVRSVSYPGFSSIALLLLGLFLFVRSVLNFPANSGLELFGALLFYLFPLLNGFPGGVSDLREIGEIVDRKSTAIYSLLGAVPLTISWLLLRGLYPVLLVDIVGLGSLALFLIYCYSRNAVPGVDSPINAEVFIIPISAVFWCGLPVLLMSVFVFLPGWLAFYVDAAYQSTEPAISSSSYEILLASKDSILALSTQLVIYIGGMAIIGMFVVFHTSAWSTLVRLESIDFRQGVSDHVRGILLGTHVLSFVLIGVGLVSAIALIGSSIFGRLPGYGTGLLFGEILNSKPIVYDSGSVESVRVEKSPTVQELFGRSLEATANYIELTPLGGYLGGGLGGAVFYLTMLVPLVVLLWIALSVPLELGLRKPWRLRGGEWKEFDFENLESDLSIYVVPDRGRPVFSLSSYFLGWKPFIVVSEDVVEELTEGTIGENYGVEALEAMVAHEQYHVDNSDLYAEMLASLLSVGFGGRNSLLSFYDYSKAEEKADEFAKKVVGAKPLMIAIDKMDEIQNESTSPGLGGAPSFGPFRDSDMTGLDVEDVGGRLRRYTYLLIVISRSPRMLYASDLLNRSAHLSVEERIDRIQSG